MSRQRHCQEGLIGRSLLTFLHMEWAASEDRAKTAPVGDVGSNYAMIASLSFSAVRHPRSTEFLANNRGSKMIDPTTAMIVVMQSANQMVME